MLPGTGSKEHLHSGSQDLGSKASGLPPLRTLIGKRCPAFFFKPHRLFQGSNNDNYSTTEDEMIGWHH